MDFSNIRFNTAFVAALFAAFVTLSGATARELQQELGTEICYCAPNAYEFTLDFTLTCPPVNITLGDAVAATTCMVSPFGAPEVADLVPVSVSSIDVLELNQNLQVVVQENIAPKESYLDGDTFSYISYAAIPGEIVNPEDLPRAIQLNIVGVNKNGEEIINVYLITFTNSCGAYPVLQKGQWAGWTRFSDLGPPSPELCPAARAPSSAPTLAPTPLIMSMSMSMSMDMGGLEGFSIEDLLDGEFEYEEKSKGKGKSGKREKAKSGAKAGKSNKDSPKEANKLSKPNSKDGKAKDGKAKDGKAKDGKSRGKDGAKVGKSEKAKDGAKAGKSGKPNDDAKAGKFEKAKDGAKAGKSEKDSTTKETNKLSKPGSKNGKPSGKDGAKAGKSEKAKDGAKDGKTEKAKDGAKAGKTEKGKDGTKAGKASKYEENNRKESIESKKETNKLTKPDKSKGKAGGKAGTQRLRI